MSFSQSTNYLLSGGADKQISLWNVASGKLIHSFSGQHNHDIHAVLPFEQDSKFASVGGDKLFYIWDVMKQVVIRKQYAHTQSLTSCALNKSESVLATASNDASIALWDLKSKAGKPIQQLTDFRDNVSAVVVMRDRIIGASTSGELRTFDLRLNKGCLDQF